MNANAKTNRITITRLLWATTLTALGATGIVQFSNQHLPLAVWVLTGSIVAGVGAISYGHLGAWCGAVAGTVLFGLAELFWRAGNYWIWVAGALAIYAGDLLISIRISRHQKRLRNRSG